MAPQKNGRKIGRASQRNARESRPFNPENASQENAAREKSLPKRALRPASSKRKASSRMLSSPREERLRRRNESFVPLAAREAESESSKFEAPSPKSSSVPSKAYPECFSYEDGDEFPDEGRAKSPAPYRPKPRRRPPTEDSNPVQQLTDKEADEKTLGKAIQDLHDPWLQMVVTHLLTDFNERNQREATQNVRRNRRGIVPRNLNPSPRQFKREARDFVKSCQINQVGNCIPALAVECLSVVSDLTDHDHPSISRLKRRGAQVIPVDIAHQHQLKECDEEIAYTIKEPNGTIRSGKRRVRGICKHCKKKTKYYCLTCEPSHGAKHYWLCHGRNGSSCHASHLQDLENL